MDSFASYFNENESLKLVIWLLDSRRTLSKEDIDFYEFLKDLNVKSLLVFTKSDKLNQSEKSKVIKMAKENLSEFEYILTSSLNKRNIEDLRKKIETKLYED